MFLSAYNNGWPVDLNKDYWWYLHSASGHEAIMAIQIQGRVARVAKNPGTNWSLGQTVCMIMSGAIQYIKRLWVKIPLVPGMRKEKRERKRERERGLLSAISCSTHFQLHPLAFVLDKHRDQNRSVNFYEMSCAVCPPRGKMSTAESESIKSEPKNTASE